MQKFLFVVEIFTKYDRGLLFFAAPCIHVMSTVQCHVLLSIDPSHPELYLSGDGSLGLPPPPPSEMADCPNEVHKIAGRDRRMDSIVFFMTLCNGLLFHPRAKDASDC